MTSSDRSETFAHRLSSIKHIIASGNLQFFRGIEKEGLRTDPQFNVAQSDHPRALGHPLTHPSITTDYSEALLELITPVADSRDALLDQLQDIHAFVQQGIGDELLWAGSMPCRLRGEESIRIAEYGPSNVGRLKHVYRQGLGVRYGRIMQSIAGLHYNFSLNESFWHAWKDETRSDTQTSAESLQDFKSRQYFAAIRNFRRYSWLLMYLFGASPALDRSFLGDRDHDLEQMAHDADSLYRPWATSLRMGDLGYHNNAQSSLAICFNTLDNFTRTLGHAIQTPYAPYEEIGIERDGKFIQLNTNILQIENEYYSAIRPKRTAASGERPTQALNSRGVEYLEVRCLDLNPFQPLGIAREQVDFLDLFLLYCLLEESPFIPDEECVRIDNNFTLTVNQGRHPDLTLHDGEQKKNLRQWGAELLDRMLPLAEAMNALNQDHRYTDTLKRQSHKLDEPELTPASQILQTMESERLSWVEFAGELSSKHKRIFAQNCRDCDFAALKEAAIRSFSDAESIRKEDSVDFSEYLRQYQA